MIQSNRLETRFTILLLVLPLLSCVLVLIALPSLFTTHPGSGWIDQYFFGILTVVMASMNVLLFVGIITARRSGYQRLESFLRHLQPILFALTMFYIGYIFGAGGSTLGIFKDL